MALMADIHAKGHGKRHIFHGAKSSGMPSVLSDLDSKFSDHSSFEDACPTASRGTNRNFLEIVRWASTLNMAHHPKVHDSHDFPYPLALLHRHQMLIFPQRSASGPGGGHGVIQYI